MEIGYLVSKDSSADFTSFERVDEIVDEGEVDSASGSFVLSLITTVLVAILVLAVIDLISIIRAITN